MSKKLNFIDLCAGCGGLSLGLMNAGWAGLFAVEKDSHAFSTLFSNLVKEKGGWFDWPIWLPREAISLESLLAKHESDLKELRGQVTLLAGGPPCQGFSSIGRRLAHDPRNHVFKNYLKLVDLVQPAAVLMENVRGIMHPFTRDPHSAGNGEKSPIYADLIKTALDELDYQVWSAIVHAKDYGVPQTRPRFILIGVRRQGHSNLAELKPFNTLTNRLVERFFGSRKLADIRYDPYLQGVTSHIVQHGKGKLINWAILDFSAIICKSAKPLCGLCPLARHCCYVRRVGSRGVAVI